MFSSFYPTTASHRISSVYIFGERPKLRLPRSPLIHVMDSSDSDRKVRGASVAACARRLYLSARRRYIKLSSVDPHLLYLEAGADHLAGDRALVCLLDSLRHGCESRAQRATRAVVAPVLSGARLFLVSGVVRPPHSGVTGTRESGWRSRWRAERYCRPSVAVAVRGAAHSPPACLVTPHSQPR
ncbi:unnamed protein product [Spodoptera exigua]|nr:unnamed protein product [Spodoptera exigua]